MNGASSHPPAERVATAPPLRCRAVVAADTDALVGLLARGFGTRSESWWRRGLDRHLAVVAGGGRPIGYLMEAAGEPVGVVLTLWSSRDGDGGPHRRCNLSSWYVDPRYRAYAALLDQMVLRDRDATHLNISAARHTWPIHEARGFQRYATGQFVAVPLLNSPRRGVRIEVARQGSAYDGMTEDERRLLHDHAHFGCICLIARDRDGVRPFVFVRSPWERLRARLGWRRSPLSYAQLVYCRSTEELPRFAHALGRHLLVRHRMPWFLVDAVGPIPSLAGRFLPGVGVRFCRGPEPMRLGDLAYTEMVLFAD